jgi:hypothetical protein
MKFNFAACVKSKNVAILIAYILLPFILYFIPLDWLNKQHTICLIKNIFGIECPGCGMTRAVISAVQLDFDKAIEYNKIVIIVLPIFIYTWIKNIIKIYNKTSP